MISLELMIWGGGAVGVLLLLTWIYFSGKRNATRKLQEKQVAERIKSVETAQGSDRKVEELPISTQRDKLKNWSKQ